jgi:menaquinone-dependent protoporphyrinogen IX oxidase
MYELAIGKPILCGDISNKHNREFQKFLKKKKKNLSGKLWTRYFLNCLMYGPKFRKDVAKIRKVLDLPDNYDPIGIFSKAEAKVLGIE